MAGEWWCLIGLVAFFAVWGWWWLDGRDRFERWMDDRKED